LEYYEKREGGYRGAPSVELLVDLFHREMGQLAHLHCPGRKTKMTVIANHPVDYDIRRDVPQRGIA
jgi:hypothetical protein